MPTDLTDDDWNSHRDAIRFLYLTENRKLQGHGGVMQEMSTKYGFNATKAQYERRFKKWGFQKNKKKENWEAVALKVTKRKRDNKESEVKIGGEVVPLFYQYRNSVATEKPTNIRSNADGVRKDNVGPTDLGYYRDLYKSAKHPQLDIEQVAAVAELFQDKRRQTALQYVSGKGDIELVQVLLDAGADVNAPPADRYGRTALQAAVEKGNIELVRVLFGAGADVNTLPTDRYGRTAFQAAIEEGNIELVQVLLDAGADVNAPPAGRYGRTALQAAVDEGNIDLVQVLLDAGRCSWWLC
ncbi:hypothetical protein DL768_010726 [Monosporascus sp. mg162]|nr:hypothetical protein DL768_010726 [Monosporascus sp. mg162]